MDKPTSVAEKIVEGDGTDAFDLEAMHCELLDLTHMYKGAVMLRATLVEGTHVLLSSEV